MVLWLLSYYTSIHGSGVVSWLFTTTFITPEWLCGYMASMPRLSVGVSISPELLAEIDEHTEEGERSAFIREAVRDKIGAENENE